MVTPASGRSTSSAGASPYAGSVQASPLAIQATESAGQLTSLGPFELPESIIGNGSIHRTSSVKDSSSIKSGGAGLIRKFSVTAKASVQSTGHRLRRKTSSTNQTREQSSGPITRRRSDSKTTGSVTGSAADLSSHEDPSTDFTEEFLDSDFPEGRSPISEPLTFPPVNPEGTAPTVPQQLIRGLSLTKVTKGKKKLQPFFLNVEGSRVSWSGKVRTKYFWIDDIKGLRTGQDAFIHRQDLRCLDIDPDRWLTVLYADPDRTKVTKSLSVYASTKVDLRLWMDTLDALSKHREDLMTSMTGSTERESILKAHWDSELAQQMSTSPQHLADSGLELSSVESLCRKLHIHCPKSIIQEAFSAADDKKTGQLAFQQFKNFVRRLKERQDLRPIFNSIRGDEEQGITKDQFLRFLETVQGVDLSESRSSWANEFDLYVHSVISGKVSNFASSMETQNFMNFEAFSSFMLSKASGIYYGANNKLLFDRPLNEYFISSSHNTYLKGRQLAGESSAEAYITALRRGCRCVEIDCWNGPDGKPMVTHGRTRTTAVPFSDCISVISRYAFDYSPYPLILSLEVHCDSEQQLRMVSLMKEILGERLLLKPVSNSTSKLPSPEELKYKILVKVKSSNSSLGPGFQVETATLGRQRSTSFPTRPTVSSSSAALPLLPSLPTQSPVSPPTSASTTLYSPNEQSTTPTSASSTDEESDAVLAPLVHTTPVRKMRLTNIIQPLAELGVYLQGYKFHGFDSPEAKEFNHIFSLDESKANSICNDQEDKALFEDHNLSFMSRVYPRGSRVDSSNFDPNIYWRRGVQMVALNWQTYDQFMQMNQAMFAAGSDAYGYVLKPDYMRQPRLKEGDLTHRFKLPRQHIKFTVEVISAQQLPRLPDMNRTGSINPFVEVQMFSAEDRSRGIATGTGGEQSSARGGYSGIGSPYSRRTRIVPGNGYNPQFNDVFDLSLETKYPELVFVRFVVWHSPDARYVGNKCKQLAVFTSKLGSLQPGFRHVPLYNGSGEEFIFSTLFCRIRKNNPQLMSTSLQDLSGRQTGRGLIRNMLTRNMSGDRTRERSGSLEKGEA